MAEQVDDRSERIQERESHIAQLKGLRRKEVKRGRRVDPRSLMDAVKRSDFISRRELRELAHAYE